MGRKGRREGRRKRRNERVSPSRWRATTDKVNYRVQVSALQSRNFLESLTTPTHKPRAQAL
jgi:hypothetical protein